MGSLVGVAHGFTTRRGGVSSGHLSSLNLARRPGESDDALQTNWERVAYSLAPSLGARSIAVVSQVHGARVVHVDAPSGALHPAGEADALVTAEQGVVLAVRTADCVPVLLASPHGIAAVHAGWRGTAAGVVGAAVAALRSLGDGPIVAAIGPSIAGRDYEVGDEVVEALTRAGGDPSRFVVGQSVRGRPLADVATVVEGQLTVEGVRELDRHPGSTFTDVDLWSHRRDGARAGRQAAVIVRGVP